MKHKKQSIKKWETRLPNLAAAMRAENEEAEMSDFLDELFPDGIEFQPCSNCDGHEACEDFGCAIKAGIKINRNDF